MITRTIETALLVFRQQVLDLNGTKLRRASASFQHGMAARIADRLEARHTEREAQIGAKQATGTALMVIRHQVVEQAFAETKVKLRMVSGLSFHRDAAYQAGQSAGERVDLRRPIEGSHRARLAP